MTRGRTDKLDAWPLLEYFKPLTMWLNVQNRDESMVGWSTTGEDTGMCMCVCVYKTINTTN